jgi:transposase
MIPVPSGVRIWIASGHADMRKGMAALSLLVQEHFKRDPFAGDVFFFRGRSGSLIKCLWHDGLGTSLYAKRLDRGRFIWPATATEDEIAAELAVAKSTTVAAFVRKRPEARTTFPDHLPRERVVIDPPTACACCGGNRLRKFSEDLTRTLESIPRQWKVIETVREKFTCRDCEKVSQTPAPFHTIPRGWAGPSGDDPV